MQRFYLFLTKKSSTGYSLIFLTFYIYFDILHLLFNYNINFFIRRSYDFVNVKRLESFRKSADPSHCLEPSDRFI